MELNFLHCRKRGIYLLLIKELCWIGTTYLEYKDVILTNLLVTDFDSFQF